MNNIRKIDEEGVTRWVDCICWLWWVPFRLRVCYNVEKGDTQWDTTRNTNSISGSMSGLYQFGLAGVKIPNVTGYLYFVFIITIMDKKSPLL